ncbi:MAG TPA: glycosyltransferase family 87 protein [Candidatus Limnocylindrales bacterium]|nr:glycosyltransferase family 87 protein [Candidatus Limnocylindrales bacterium]
MPTLVLGLVGVLLAAGFYANHLAPVDTLHYFQTGQSDQLYGTVWGVGTGPDAWYVYPPPFATVVRLLSFGGWGQWLVLWTVVLAVSFAVVRWVGVTAVLAGFGLRLFVDNFKPISEPANHLTIGNVQPLLLAAVVLGLRYPAMWAIPILTKIGPGIGVLWFVVRREWRSLAIALGTTAAIVGVSVLVSPREWTDWIRFITANVATPSPVPVVPIPSWIRFPAAVALIVWGARTNRPWTLPIACAIASFALYEWSFLTIWLGALAFAGPWAQRDQDGGLTLAPGVGKPGREASRLGEVSPPERSVEPA